MSQRDGLRNSPRVPSPKKRRIDDEDVDRREKTRRMEEDAEAAEQLGERQLKEERDEIDVDGQLVEEPDDLEEEVDVGEGEMSLDMMEQSMESVTMVAECDVQATDDPNVFHCIEERNTAFYLDILDKAERQNLGLGETIVQPAAGTIIIYNVDRFVQNGRQALDYDKIRRSMRIDGYRMVNAGTHKVARSILDSRGSVIDYADLPNRIAYRSYNTLYNKEDNRRIDNRFKRKEYWYQNGRCVVFHYIGDDNLAKQVAATTFHGNSKNKYSVYHRSDPLIMHLAKERLMAGARPEQVYQEMRDRSTDPSRSLKNIKQLRNVKERIDQERRKKANVFQNIHSLHDMLRFEGTRQPFICNITAIRVVAWLQCEPLIEEFINTAHLGDGDAEAMAADPHRLINTQLLHYDVSQSACGFQMGILTFRHDIFIDDPAVPLAFCIGETLTMRDHVALFENMVENFPRLKSIKMGFTSTIDGMRMEHFWPDLVEIKRWDILHAMARRDLMTSAQLRGDSLTQAMRIYHDLTAIEQEDRFDQVWRTRRAEVSDHTSVFFDDRIIPDWKKYGAPWMLEDRNIKWRENGGIFTGSVNGWSYLHKTMNEAKLSIDGVIASLFYLCQFVINEMERGYYTVGSFHIKDVWASLTDDSSNIPRQPFAPYPEEIVMFVNEVALNTNFSVQKRKRMSQGLQGAQGGVAFERRGRPSNFNQSMHSQMAIHDEWVE